MKLHEDREERVLRQIQGNTRVAHRVGGLSQLARLRSDKTPPVAALHIVPSGWSPAEWEALVDSLTRRKLIKTGLALGLITILPACGGADQPPNATPMSTTVQMTNQFGTFDVRLRPQRVVTLEGRRDLEVALALGFAPLAIGPNALLEDQRVAGFLGWQPSANVVKFGDIEPDIEQLLLLKPDLIIGRDSDMEPVASRIAQVAPPIAVDGSFKPWRSELEEVGRLLHREDQVNAVLQQYDEQLREVRERHASRITESVIAIVQWNKEWGSSSTTGFYLQAQTLGDLGGNLLPSLAGPEDEYGIVSFGVEETRRLTDADAILIIVSNAELQAEVEANELWQRLPAVQAGRVVMTDYRTNYGSVFAARESLRLLDLTYATMS